MTCKGGPLHAAAYCGNEKVVKFLIEAMPKVRGNEEREMKYSPSDIAMYYGHESVANHIRRHMGFRFVIISLSYLSSLLFLLCLSYFFFKMQPTIFGAYVSESSSPTFV